MATTFFDKETQAPWLVCVCLGVQQGSEDWNFDLLMSPVYLTPRDVTVVQEGRGARPRGEWSLWEGSMG